MIELRDYQERAVNKTLEFLKNTDKNGVLVLPTGSGKSVVIAELARRLDSNVLVFQPSKEILEQNYQKYVSYGLDASVFSASMGEKSIGKVTFAMIGSVKNYAQQLKHFKYIIVDECHLVNPEGSMYASFFKTLWRSRVIGLTATPYRLKTTSLGPSLRFITRTKSRVFHSLISYVQNGELFNRGYLCPLKYYEPFKFDKTKLRLNSTGRDYTDVSLKAYYSMIGYENIVIEYAQRLLQKRKNLLVFTRFVNEARMVSEVLGKESAYVSGETPKKEREEILRKFKSGEIRCVCNVGVLTTGFDFPELEAVLLARPTTSLSLYYQMVGRCIRTYPNKSEAWVVDISGNYEAFGKVENFQIVWEPNSLPYLSNGRYPLTQVSDNYYKQKYNKMNRKAFV